jgi:hypothetical protein
MILSAKLFWLSVASHLLNRFPALRELASTDQANKVDRKVNFNILRDTKIEVRK